MEAQNEVKEQVTTRSVGIRYGLILAVVGIAWFVIMNVAGLNIQGPAGYVSWVLTAVLIFLAQKYYKEEGDGFMTIGQGVGIGFWAGLISGVISGVFTYIYIQFIDATFIEKIRQAQIDAMQQQGMSDAQMEQAMQFGSMFTSPLAMLFFTLFGSLVLGVLIGLILSFFTQKKNPDPFVN